MIWEYAGTAVPEPRPKESPTLPDGRCRYCKSEMRRLGVKPDEELYGGYGNNQAHRSVECCDRCGWWWVYVDTYSDQGIAFQNFTHAQWPSLRTLNLADISTPLDDVQSYLIAKYSDRFNVHPRKLEELVASVFRDFGCRVEITASSNDGGIDVFVLRQAGGRQLGIQVKRYKGKIECHQIREFAGALLLHGITRGVFVTTSDFTRGAKQTATRFDNCVNGPNIVSLQIELWDAQRFYDAMQLRQRSAYVSCDDPSAPFYALWTGSARKFPCVSLTEGPYD